MAEGLAEVGATVVLNGRTIETLEAVAGTLRNRGLRAETSAFDVTDHQGTKDAIDSIVGPKRRTPVPVANLIRLA